MERNVLRYETQSLLLTSSTLFYLRNSATNSIILSGYENPI